MARAQRQRPAARIGFEQLESRLAMAGVVINEALASNVDGIVDQDGQHSDWIELWNNSAEPVDLNGWHLTDDTADLDKWQLPATILGPGGYLTIFASDKDRRVSGQELHTNFKLAAEGETLTLVMADGVTVADTLVIAGAQHDDVSYGVGTSAVSAASETLVGASSPLRVISPTGENAAVDDQWREIGFNDSGWLSGTRSVGFDRDTTPTDFPPLIGRTLTAAEMPSTGTARYTAYVRFAFNVASKEQLASLAMDLRFDDGFIAYLNGREIARANFGEDFQRPQPQWDSRAGYQQGTSSSLSATNRGSEALTPITFDLTPYLPSLVNGSNVLSFHVVNSASTAAAGSGQDFLLEPVLTAQRSSGAQLGFMQGPTPGGANGLTALGIIGDTHFSVDRGFFSAPFQTEITVDAPIAAVRYTTDGSLPTPDHGTIYTGPITIAATTILRAIAYLPGNVSSNVDTQTYIFLADVIGQNTSDVTQPYAPWGHDKEDADTTSGYNLDNEADWEMDPQVVSANSATIIDDLKTIPSVSLVMDWDDLFGGTPLPGTPAGSGAAAPAPQGIYIHGTSSERYASFEFFDPQNAADQVHADVAVEMQGHSSTLRWNTDKMSLQVKFKYPYGDTALDYPLFADTPGGASAASEFDTLILDAGYNYGWLHNNVQQRDFARYVTDQVVSDLQNLASGGSQAPHGRYVHLYLNGLYWGMYNMHERPDESFAADSYGGDKDDYHVVKSTSQDLSHKYSWVEGGVAAELSYAALVAATRNVESNPTSVPTYAAVQAMLDVDQFIDYMIVHYYAGGGADWPHNNWYGTQSSLAGGKWRFHAWDQEHAFPTSDNGDAWTQITDITAEGTEDAESPGELHFNLMANSEYRLRFADRAQEHLYNGGALTPTVARAVYEARTQEIDRAIVAESARWGDNRVANDPYTRADFVTTRDAVLNTFFPARTGALLGHFDLRGWIPTLEAPLLSQYGGAIPVGYDLALTKPAGAPAGGVIYYTIDGSDPRLPGGALNPTASLYAGPINLPTSTRVQARIFFDAAGTANDWSPLVDKTFLAPELLPLRIVELNYNPDAQPGVPIAEDLEFIELLNAGASTISLNGVQIAGFTTTPYSFAPGQTLAAGARIVVSRTPAVFTQFYGNGINVAPGGYGDANLSNGGELVELTGPAGEILQRFTYDDVAPWPTTPDGAGYSLEIIDPLGDATSPSNWRASFQLGGSPGTDGSPQAGTPGDFDGDDDVDGADLLAWQRGLGTPAPNATKAEGDADGDKDVDAADLALWRGNFGEEPLIAAAARAEFAASSPAAALGREDWIPVEAVKRPLVRRNPTRERFADAAFATWDAQRCSAKSSHTVDASLPLRKVVRLASSDKAVGETECELTPDVSGGVRQRALQAHS